MPRLTKKQKEENEARAQRARNVMDAYTLEIGRRDDSNLTDLLTDLMHMAREDCEVPDFNCALQTAQMHFNAERSGSN